MSAKRISERYARALFEVAQERNVLSTIYADMQMIRALYKQSAPLRRFLENPILKTFKKEAVLKALFAKKLHALSLQISCLLTQKGRIAHLHGLADAFIARYQASQGMLPVQLLVAAPLTDALQEEITQYIEQLTHKQPLLDTQLRTELIGGFVLRFGTQQLDKSVATQLRKLRKNLMQPSPTAPNA